ncbi:Protein of unknown function [Gryllus bimaculatus]|nr:Protein of unknown function [Gryllus bimaculatus]
MQDCGGILFLLGSPYELDCSQSNYTTADSYAQTVIASKAILRTGFFKKMEAVWIATLPLLD